ncbi:hypothetical protein BBJ28_00011811 [Nothophytophthora sp. Chile5]|nr:hypothetical protein BBJ28_00011811 [Nothophytophthora sp. Chile5]
MIQDDENDASGEESRDDVSENAGHNGEDNGEVSGTGDDKGDGEMVRASQIDCSVALSANTVDALFRSDREGGETPDLSQNVVGRAVELSQPDTADTMDVTEHTVVIGAFQWLLSEMEPDSESGDESVEETKDDRGCDDDGGPLVPRDPAGVNVMKPEDHRDDYESLSSNSDYGQFSDDDYVEPVRPQPNEDGSSDDEESPHMDAAFIEALGGSLSIDQMDQNALRNLKWSAASSVLEDELSCFRGLVQETAHPIPGLRPKKDSPLDLMFYFLPKSLWMRITRETSRVKRQTVDQRARFERARVPRTENMQMLRDLRRRIRREGNYKPHEILRLIGLLVARMLNPTRRFSQHWAMTDDGALTAGAFGKFMSRNRCTSILRDLHFANNDNPNRQDKLWKIRDVVDVLQERFMSAWTPPNIISFDEGVLPTTFRRNTTRMIMPDRPHRYGTKMFMTCDSVTAYCHR